MREYNITGASIWLLTDVYVAETITWFSLLVGSCPGVSDTRAIPHLLGKTRMARVDLGQSGAALLLTALELSPHAEFHGV